MLFLEKELVALGGMCAASLLKEDTVLPFAGQSPLERYIYKNGHIHVLIRDERRKEERSKQARSCMCMSVFWNCSPLQRN